MSWQTIWVTLIIIVILCVGLAKSRVKYEGDKVFTIIPRNQEEFWVIHHLQDKEKMDFTTDSKGKVQTVTFSVKPRYIEHMEHFLDERDIRYAEHDADEREDNLIDDDHIEHDNRDHNSLDWRLHHNGTYHKTDPKDFDFFDDFDSDDEDQDNDDFEEKKEEDKFFDSS